TTSNADVAQITAGFTVLDDGRITDISLPTQSDAAKKSAFEQLAELQYMPEPGAAPLKCSYNLVISPN
ncbi:MAG: hypothetical protein ACR2QG_03470, partial [Gammaproteobacteria bacterium]